MKVAATRVRSYREPKSILGKIIQFPLVRSVIGIIFVVLPLLIISQILHYLLSFSEPPWTSYLRDISTLLKFALAIWFYSLFTRLIEKRPADEMSASGAVLETGAKG